MTPEEAELIERSTAQFPPGTPVRHVNAEINGIVIEPWISSFRTHFPAHYVPVMWDGIGRGIVNPDLLKIRTIHLVTL